MFTEMRKHVTNQILSALADIQLPWRKPWLRHLNDGPPTNVLTNLSFRGSNRILLQRVAQRQSFKSRWWGTEKVWNVFGFRVKPHQQGSQVFYGKVQNQMVFNAEQVHGPGIERYLVRETPATLHPAFDAADKIIAATKADIRHVHGDEANYYRPPQDYIVLPLKSQFVNGPGGLAGYYGTILHELTHMTEHRLGWLPDPHLTNKERYALAEIRAQLGSAYLIAEVGIPFPDAIPNHAKYIGMWMKAFNAEPSVIMQVASAAANEAVDFILSFSRQQNAVA